MFDCFRGNFSSIENISLVIKLVRSTNSAHYEIFHLATSPIDNMRIK